MTKTAHLIIDVMNLFAFPGGKQLQRNANSAAKNVFEYCTRKGSLGLSIAKTLRPTSKDYVILKSKHSGFYSTSLDVLLAELKISKLIVSGFAGNICVLFTVNDAYMRGYDIHVPANCIASNTSEDHRYVIRQLKTFGINTHPFKGKL